MVSRASAAAREYEELGYTIVRNVVPAELVREVQEHIDWLGRTYPDKRPEQYNSALIRDDPFWVRVVGDERLVDLASEFVGSDIGLFASQYICKPPKIGYPVHWHQDGAYWPLAPMEVVTLWLAITDATVENGCMRVIPGSHLRGIQPTEYYEGEESVFKIRIVPGTVDESAAVDIVLGPGDIAVLHPNIIHGSEPNRSSSWRCGLTVRYIPTTTKILTPEYLCPFHFRGEPRPEINQWLARPKYVEGTHMPFDGCEAWA